MYAILQPQDVLQIVSALRVEERNTKRSIEQRAHCKRLAECLQILSGDSCAKALKIEVPK